MSEVREVRKRSSLAEQESSLGNKAENEGVCPVEAMSGTWEEYRDIDCHHRKKSCVIKAQLELKPELWGTTKRVFPNMLMAKGIVEITSAHSRMKMSPQKQGQGHSRGVQCILCLHHR